MLYCVFPLRLLLLLPFVILMVAQMFHEVKLICEHVKDCFLLVAICFHSLGRIVFRILCTSAVDLYCRSYLWIFSFKKGGLIGRASTLRCLSEFLHLEEFKGISFKKGGKVLVGISPFRGI